MNLFSILFLLCGCIVTVAVGNQLSETSHDEEDVSVTYARLLQRAVEREPWSPAEQPCARTLLTVLQHAHNFTLHALWMLDAMQLPHGKLFGSESHLGNYDECLEPRWRHSHPQLSSQYCLAEVQLVPSQRRPGYVPDPELSAEAYLKTRTDQDLDLAKMYWGICLPAECPESAVSKLYRVLLRTSHLGPLAEQATIDVNYCQVAGEAEETKNGLQLLIVMMVSLVIITLCSTYYVRNYKLNPESYVHEAVRCFSADRNLASLTTVRDDEVYVMNSMRIISSTFIVLGHCLCYKMPKFVVNGLHMDEEMEKKGAGQIHGNLALDTFFVLSGLLVSRGFLSGSRASPIKFIIKRYMRLMTFLALILFVKTWVQFEVGGGPLWRRWMAEDLEICRRSVWLSFTLMHNWGLDKFCYLVSWSTALDFQMSVVVMLLCLVFLKNRQCGVFVFLTALLAALVTPGYIQHKNNLPVAFFYGFESHRDLRKNIVFASTYVWTHCRAAPFFVGMIMAYVMTNYKLADNRKCISKIASYIYLVICLTVMLLMVQLGGDYYYRHPAAAGSAAFTSLNRAVFAAAVCGVIATAEYGDLGILDGFFKWSPLVPLGRLTYGVYLVHGIIVERNTYNNRSGFTWDIFTFVCEALGTTAISYFLSFVVWVVMEGPVMNIVNLLLDGLRKLKPKTNDDPSEKKESS